jgi:hypothetical protein
MTPLAALMRASPLLEKSEIRRGVLGAGCAWSVLKLGVGVVMAVALVASESFVFSCQ